ncbi:MAG: helix-turn-helix domain-containing protein [Segniliparus sp.]|uniref:helix-turn-helix domain-containing protein n=1 Tax=Segniliparus sp. TaxID=2804064 RepID=UPI003F37AFAB
MDSAPLDSIGPRLRLLRQRRSMTLRDVAEATAITTSTLSRLESGQRKPTLELLLPLARLYRVALDEIVDAPPTGDPRVHLRPIRRDGKVVVPLTRRPGGLQALKFVHPPSSGEAVPQQRSHEGYIWVYVLNGALRLVLGDKDLVMRAGEVAEFDTRVPHWLASAGPEPVEYIGIYGPNGERMRGVGDPDLADL